MKQALYVEDSATSQLLMRKYINNLCELTITPTPRQARALLAERTFDLLITDFHFPDCDALGLIQFARTLKNATQMPIVVISSSMDGTLLSRVLKAGGNEGLSKPLNTENFRAVVTRMLSSPYVHEIDQTLAGVHCFQWMQNGQYHQYCPELNLTLSGPTREDVSANMLHALQERMAQGTPLGYTTHELIATHIVQIGHKTLAPT